MIVIYNTLIHDPLLNVLIFFYNTIALEDLGLAIIFLTILIRLILYPLFHKGLRHQTAMQVLQPKIKKIQDDHKNNKEKQMEAMFALYKEHKVNPFSGFFIILAQLPILIALYRIFLSVFDEGALDTLYSFVGKPDVLNKFFLGLINLSEPSIIIVSVAALVQYFQAKMALPKLDGKQETQAGKIAKSMVFLGPILTLFIFYGMPAAVSLYWAATSVFSIFQQKAANKSLKNDGTGNLGKKNV